MSIFDMMNDFEESMKEGAKIIEEEQIRDNERCNEANRKRDRLNKNFINPYDSDFKKVLKIRLEQSYGNFDYHANVYNKKRYGYDSYCFYKYTLNNLAWHLYYEKPLRKHMMLYISNKKIDGYKRIDFLYSIRRNDIKHVLFSEKIKMEDKWMYNTICDGENMFIKYLNLKEDKIKTVYIKLDNIDVSDYI